MAACLHVCDVCHAGGSSHEGSEGGEDGDHVHEEADEEAHGDIATDDELLGTDDEDDDDEHDEHIRFVCLMSLCHL